MKPIRNETLTTGRFLEILGALPSWEGWEAYLHKGYILLRRADSNEIYSPLTAVYYFLTQQELHRGSYWQTTIVEEFQFHWWDVLEISQACTSCNSTVNMSLRRSILKLLELPLLPQTKAD